jgi:hypothetical protein
MSSRGGDRKGLPSTTSQCARWKAGCWVSRLGDDPGLSDHLRSNGERMAKTCREEILEAFKSLEKQYGRNDFDVVEVLQAVQSVTSSFKESTIRTHITSRMCAQAPVHHGTVYADLDRVGPGRYRRHH